MTWHDRNHSSGLPMECMVCGAGDALGLQLPVTLLYDCQSVTEIAAFINGRLNSRDAAGAADGGAGFGEPYAERDVTEFVHEPDRPSKLLKTLRYVPS